ncbi:UNVERIFIED_CONTAM: GAF domain-containing protein [Hammondia hammondi]|eukprot:XP_008882446.1 GAF domain-containing protein [Hammondia hammondi]
MHAKPCAYPSLLSSPLLSARLRRSDTRSCLKALATTSLRPPLREIKTPTASAASPTTFSFASASSTRAPCPTLLLSPSCNLLLASSSCPLLPSPCGTASQPPPPAPSASSPPSSSPSTAESSASSSSAAPAPASAPSSASAAAPSAEMQKGPLTWEEWWHVFGFCALPMVAFGMMDQFIMIRLGEFVDATLGVTFGLATLSAAAVGQLCSDTAGVVFGSTIESIAQRVGVTTPPFDIYSKRAPSSTQVVRTLGAACGVAFGCLLGMSQLLFMDLDRSERLKKQQRLDAIFQMVIQDCPQLFGCERATLFVYDKNRNEVWSKAIFGLEHATRIDKNAQEKSLTTWVLEHKQLVNCPDARSDPRFNPQFDEKHKACTKSVLAAPVFGKDGDVIAVLTCFNKQRKGREERRKERREEGRRERSERRGGQQPHEEPEVQSKLAKRRGEAEDALAFTVEDEKVIRLLSKNLAVFMDTFDYGATEDQKVIALPFEGEEDSPLAARAGPPCEAVPAESAAGAPQGHSLSGEQKGEASTKQGELETQKLQAEEAEAQTRKEKKEKREEEEKRKVVKEKSAESGEALLRAKLLSWLTRKQPEKPSAEEAAQTADGEKTKFAATNSTREEAVLISRFDLPLLGAPVPEPEEELEKPKHLFWWTGKREKKPQEPSV